MIRGTFANIRLRNQLARRGRGWLHPRLHPRGRPADDDLRRVRGTTQAAGHPARRPGGQGVRLGSSRDWAAKGTSLLGVKAVIAESYERIHRSNLIGMGVLPLQFPEGENAESLGLDGTETFDISGVTALNDGVTPRDRG
jgi:aconitate hydratase